MRTAATDNDGLVFRAFDTHQMKKQSVQMCLPVSFLSLTGVAKSGGREQGS